MEAIVRRPGGQGRLLEEVKTDLVSKNVKKCTMLGWGL